MSVALELTGTLPESDGLEGLTELLPGSTSCRQHYNKDNIISLVPLYTTEHFFIFC